jgi:hypothetical protein
VDVSVKSVDNREEDARMPGREGRMDLDLNMSMSSADISGVR